MAKQEILGFAKLGKTDMYACPGDPVFCSVLEEPESIDLEGMYSSFEMRKKKEVSPVL